MATVTTRDAAIAQATEAAAALADSIAYLEATDPSHALTRLHRKSALLAADWEDHLGLAYGTLKGDDGDPKPPSP